MGDLTVEQVTGPVAHHGEGPLWWGGTLLWVDMLKGDLLALDGGTVTRTHVGDVAACVRPRAGGGLVVAVERGFALLDDLGGAVRALPEVWGSPQIRMNDGGCDPDGRFYCGTMAYDATPGAGALYRLDPDGAVTTAIEGVTVSNGFGFSPDGGTAYYCDTATNRVDAFDYDRDAGLTNRRPFAEVEQPDGLTVDAEGGVWVARWGGSAVQRHTPAGALDAVVELPVSQVTACAFGPDRLYITTSREGADGQAEAGAVFAVAPGVAGLPALPFAG